MKMKLEDIFVHYEEITGLEKNKIKPNAIINKSLPPKLNYAITKNVKAFKKEILDYERIREDTIKKFCEKDENGNIVFETTKAGKRPKMSDEEEKIVLKELSDIMEMEVDINIMKVPFSAIEQCEESERYHILTGKEIMILDFMISD